MSDFTLLVPFLTDSPYFVLGWEAAIVFQKMHAKEKVITGHYHCANDEQLFLMASRMGYKVDWRRAQVTDEWMWCRFELRNA